MRLRSNDALDRHGGRSVGQANQRAAMHKSRALSVVEEKGHREGCHSVASLNYSHIQKPLKRGAAYPLPKFNVVGPCSRGHFFFQSLLRFKPGYPQDKDCTVNASTCTYALNNQ